MSFGFTQRYAELQVNYSNLKLAQIHYSLAPAVVTLNVTAERVAVSANVCQAFLLKSLYHVELSISGPSIRRNAVSHRCNRFQEFKLHTGCSLLVFVPLLCAVAPPGRGTKCSVHIFVSVYVCMYV